MEYTLDNFSLCSTCTKENPKNPNALLLKNGLALAFLNSWHMKNSGVFLLILYFFFYTVKKIFLNVPEKTFQNIVNICFKDLFSVKQCI